MSDKSRVFKADSDGAVATVTTKDGRIFKITQKSMAPTSGSVARFDPFRALELTIKHASDWLECDDGWLIPVANISTVKVTKE